jgi:hypothetical protein
MLKIVKDKLPENNELPLTTYGARQHMERNRLCALWGWRFRRSMPALMIASSIEARNTKIWKLVLCATRYVIRSGEMMIVVLPRGHLPR